MWCFTWYLSIWGDSRSKSICLQSFKGILKKPEVLPVKTISRHLFFWNNRTRYNEKSYFGRSFVATLNGGYNDFKEFMENRKYFRLNSNLNSINHIQKLNRWTYRAISHRLMGRKFIFLSNLIFDHSWPRHGQ